ncbi:cation:proton antiporter [Undibacterium sp.]|jgi:NhaP-type Na+/H+ or K+/H+ antiporter|uniref:cation:proton antiporter n=1 Tax=Undibacterium sp. TaxID=1914977 RepID=UPI002B93D544|nr:cation:proton antiporter [Undibacterium sp.]HTD07171.1 cation:proton antiporter [Undibacterium sp.]
MISHPLWFLLVGGLLLFMGLTSSRLKRLPVTSAIIYLAVGLLVGPTVLNLFHFNPLKESALLEVLTEAAVLISLFSAGVKMPVPVNITRWRTPVLLATLSMTASVALVAAFAYYVLGLPPGACILLGAIVAPTDPVLATDVQIRHPGDNDQLRFTLTCEAGMNDGSAFPFVMLGMGWLGLHDVGEAGMRWVLLDVMWATAAGILLGVVSGALLARLIWKIRGQQQSRDLMDDFLGLGLIGVVYGISVLIGAWGFLAVFFAAVALHQTELKLAGAIRHTQERPKPISANEAALPEPKSVAATGVPVPGDAAATETVSEGSLVFKEHLERLSEVVLILLVGGMLFVDSWSWRAAGFAFFLFLVARPVSVMLGMLGSGASWRMRGMTGWFGVRGIGSLYYLMYAIQRGLPEALALQLIQLTLIVITLSIVVHGTSVKPLMNLVWRRRREKRVP